MKTFDLLLTSPVTSAAIVLGKYFATLVTIFALISVSFIYPMVTRRVFEFDWAPTLVSALGIFLIVSLYMVL